MFSEDRWWPVCWSVRNQAYTQQKWSYTTHTHSSLSSCQVKIILLPHIQIQYSSSHLLLGWATFSVHTIRLMYAKPIKSVVYKIVFWKLHFFFCLLLRPDGILWAGKGEILFLSVWNFYIRRPNSLWYVLMIFGVISYFFNF